MPTGGGGFGLLTDNEEPESWVYGVCRRLFFNADTVGGGGGAAADGGNGGAPPGARGAAPFGMGGALGEPDDGLRLLVSGSESYTLIPPALFRSFGMPTPANKPPNCGAVSITAAGLPP